ncbi:hypothetical protein [Bacteroides reticulotermitis]|uniref:hypothetical protein n=1 Tax=Bacteroides reticulotermitis TaxID=1133319 RepID=UPI003A885CEC
MKSKLLCIASVAILSACSSSPQPLTINDFAGSYVTDCYEQRGEGYDWSAVTIRALTDSTATISIRSRMDEKKPTCRFDAVGVLFDKDRTLTTTVEGGHIFFSLDADSLSISSDDESLLTYFCSGGGSMAGKYAKLQGELDSSQLDKRSFSKVLSWDKYFFDIEVLGNQLIVSPANLEISNRVETHDITGYTVVDAQIGDLNMDNYPEVFIYLSSDGSGSYGKLIGYSVNNGKSMSMVYLPEISSNKEISDGYMGHDQMEIVGSTFIQRFPIYKPGDTNANPTGNIRQVQYQLVDGEAGRVLKVVQVKDVP